VRVIFQEIQLATAQISILVKYYRLTYCIVIKWVRNGRLVGPLDEPHRFFHQLTREAWKKQVVARYPNTSG
jgi:hypothetical protein